MAADILIHRQGQQLGPYAEAAVHQMLADGRLQAEDMAWRPGMADWKPLSHWLANGFPAAVGVAPPPRAASSQAAKWVLAGVAMVAVLAVAGVGVWQTQQSRALEAQKQQLIIEQQQLADEQARTETQRQQQEAARILKEQEEEKQKAAVEQQRLAEEKQAAEEKSRALEAELQAERRAAARERQRVAKENLPPAPPPNAGSPYGTANTSYGNPGSPPPPPPPIANICRECGVVQSVRMQQQAGEGSGAGAVLGGVVGGLLGNQVGRGRGRDAATVVGAVGGAVAGHQIEKSQRSTTSYEVVVRFEDGSVRSFNTPQAWRQGDRVRLYNGSLINGY